MDEAQEGPASEGTLTLTRSQIAQRLDMATCIEIMRILHSFLWAPSGHGHQVTFPVRSVFELPARAPAPKFFGSMPAHARFASGEELFGAKCLSVFPGNPQANGREAHQGVFALFHGDDGRLLALFDAGEITAQRTAATSAVAARYLLPTGCDISEGAGTAVVGISVAIAGTGVQARRHALALATAMRRTRRPVRSFRLCARDPGGRAALACQQDIVQALSAEAISVVIQPLHRAVVDCDVLCTVTSSREPILTYHEHVSKRVTEKPLLIIAVGACTPDARELGGDLVAAAGDHIWVDNREAAAREAGDLLLAAQEKSGHAVKAPDKLEELAEVVARPERHNRAIGGRVAVFKSLGNGAQDLAVAKHLYDAARAEGTPRVHFDA